LKKIVICEDHRIVYDGLELFLAGSKEYAIVGYAANGKALITLLKDTDPDILILDLNLPGSDGFTLLHEIRTRNEKIRIIILTMYNDSFLIEKAREERANAYLLKNASNEEIMAALAQLDENNFYVTRSVQHEMDRRKIYRDRFAQKMKLTRRELEVIEKLARGESSQEIAEKLFLSQHTVETHRKNIFRKLEINNIADLVRFAHENGIA